MTDDAKAAAIVEGFYTTNWDTDMGAQGWLEHRILQALRDARAEEREAAAETAFEHVRCDDRTDRWMVANEVAHRIRERGMS